MCFSFLAPSLPPSLPISVDVYCVYTCVLPHLDSEVGVGVEQLSAESEQQLLVSVDYIRRLDECLHPNSLHAHSDR